MLLLKIRLKNTQNHDVTRGPGGFLSVGVQASILHPNQVQRVLPTQGLRRGLTIQSKRIGKDKGFLEEGHLFSWFTAHERDGMDFDFEIKSKHIGNVKGFLGKRSLIFMAHRPGIGGGTDSEDNLYFFTFGARQKSSFF